MPKRYSCVLLMTDRSDLEDAAEAFACEHLDLIDYAHYFKRQPSLLRWLRRVRLGVGAIGEITGLNELKPRVLDDQRQARFELRAQKLMLKLELEKKLKKPAPE
jgi:hypothetical protein